MSILNAHVSADRVLIGVDTDARLPNGEHQVTTSKLFAIPHVLSLVAFRGLLFTLQRLYWEIMLPQPERPIGTFDELVADMPRALAVTWREAAALIPPEIQEGMGDTVIVAGWSTSRARASAVVFDRKATLGEYVSFEIEERQPYLGPNMLHATHPVCRQSMYELAQAQCEFIEREGATLSGGGELLCAEVSRDAIHIEKAGPLVRKPGVRRAIGGVW